MREQFVIIESESSDTNYYIEQLDGEKVIMFDLLRDEDGDMMPIPLRSIPHDRMPPEFDQFRRQHGVYIIIDPDDDSPLYVGESHTGRLIHTATRHIQTWNLGPSWNREEVLFAFIICKDPGSAFNLQNLIMAEFILNGHELPDNTKHRPLEFDYVEDDTPF